MEAPMLPDAAMNDDDEARGKSPKNCFFNHFCKKAHWCLPKALFFYTVQLLVWNTVCQPPIYLNAERISWTIKRTQRTRKRARR
jgi:hypothetical protein